MREAPVLACFAHHRCASSWIRHILSEVCAELGATLHVQGGGNVDDKILAALSEGGTNFVYCRNASRQQAAQLRPFRGFHVVRDPRDVAVSAYFSHKHSHALGGWLTQEYRDRLTTLDQDAGLLLEIERSAMLFRAMAEWNYRNPAVLELQMETLTADPVSGFEQAFEFLGIRNQLPESSLSRILDKHSFEAESGGRQRGEESVTSHYRKGVAGDWINYFRPVHVQYFKDHYTDMLIKLGYEQGADW